MANTKVTGDVIANGTISTVHIADDAITAAKLDSTATGITFADLAVDTDTLYVDSANNRVGIGTTNPNAKLNVKSAGSTTDEITLTHSGNTVNIVAIGQESSHGSLFLRANSGVNKVRLSAAGNDSYILDSNVGIGTTTNISSPLTVQTDGSANSLSIIGRNNGTSDEAIISFYEYDGTTRNSYIIKEGGNLAIATGTGGSPSERMRITSGGDVIIGGTVVENPNSVNRAFEIAAASPVGLILNDTRDANPITLENVGAVFHVSHGTNRRLTILDSSGNVGIGTTSPGHKLDVAGSGKFQPGIADGDALVTIAQTNSNAYVHAGIKINAGNTNPFYIYQSGSSNTLRFNYNSLADAGGQLVITDSGNVGIGTNSPGHKLQINDGSILIEKDQQSGGTDHNFIQLVYNGSWSGNVNGLAAINVTDGLPSNQTVGKFGITYNGSQGKFVLTNLYNGGYGASGDVFTVTAVGTTYMAGNVGIGTTSPSRKLYVGGAALIDGIGNTNKGTLMLGPQTAGAGKWSVLTGAHYNATSGSGNGSGSAGIMMIGTYAGNGENNVVIGGSIYEANAATSIQFWTHTTDTSTAGGTERMRITSSGNVGIGVASPFGPLHVNGGTNGPSTVSNMSDAGIIVSNGTGGRAVQIATDNTDNFNYIQSAYVNNCNIANELRFYVGAVNIMTFNTSANVGIGINSPGEKLVVAGNIKANDVNGKFYTNAYTVTTASSVDTFSHSGAGLWEYTIRINPNPGGSGSYEDFYYGKVGIGTGWNGSNVTDYIWYQEDQTAPRSLYPSGGGDKTISFVMVSGGSEVTNVVHGTTITVRIKGFGGHASYSQGIEVYFRRLA